MNFFFILNGTYSFASGSNLGIGKLKSRHYEENHCYSAGNGKDSKTCPVCAERVVTGLEKHHEV